MLDQFEALTIFDGLDQNALEAIGMFSESLDLDDGEEIISEQTKDEFDLYLLVSGCVEVIALGHDRAAVSEEVVISKQDKDIFGEIGWLFRSHRTATVRSHGKTTIIRVGGDNLRRYLEENPAIGYLFMTHMAKHLAKTVTETSNLLKQVLWVHGI